MCLRVGRLPMTRGITSTPWTARAAHFSTGTSASAESAVALSDKLSASAPWSSLSKSHQSTLVFLGVSEAHWNDGSLPSSINLPFERLSLQQQAAVQHGLNLSASQWDEFVFDRNALDTDVALSAGPTSGSLRQNTRDAVAIASPTSPLRTFAHSAASVMWTVTKVAVPLLRPTLARSSHPLATVALLAGEVSRRDSYLYHRSIFFFAAELLLHAPVLMEATEAPIVVEVQLEGRGPC